MQDPNKIDLLKDDVARMIDAYRNLDNSQKKSWASQDEGKRYCDTVKRAIMALPKVRNDAWPPAMSAWTEGPEPGCCAAKYSDLLLHLGELLEILKAPYRPELRA